MDAHGTRGRTTRRRFLDWLLGTTVGGLVMSVIYPVVRFVVPPPDQEAATNTVTLDLDPRDVPPNSGRIFRFGREPGILIRTPSGDLRAFSAVCTHLSCTVQYREDLGHIWCACHNGHYDLNGVNIAGPPPRPLPRYDLRVLGSTINVAKRA